MKKPRIGAIVVNRKLTTQVGEITAAPGTKLVSVFLGAFKEDEEPDPEGQLHKLGYRQMAMYETCVRICIPAHGEMPLQNLDWRLVYSELGAVDAVEAAVRFAHKMISEELDRGSPGTPAPYLELITVGTMQIGPIAEDGTPHNGRGPSFFGWKHGRGTELNDHLEALRAEARKAAER